VVGGGGEGIEVFGGCGGGFCDAGEEWERGEGGGEKLQGEGVSGRFVSFFGGGRSSFGLGLFPVEIPVQCSFIRARGTHLITFEIFSAIPANIHLPPIPIPGLLLIPLPRGKVFLQRILLAASRIDQLFEAMLAWRDGPDGVMLYCLACST
jgi:hypothetical protein